MFSVTAAVCLLVASALGFEELQCEFSGSECKYGVDRTHEIQVIYSRTLRRCPKVHEFDKNIGIIERFPQDINKVHKDLVASPEFESNLEGQTTENKVRIVYDAILGRKPTETEIKRWRNTVERNRGVRTMTGPLFASAEYRNNFQNPGKLPGPGRCDIDCGVLDSVTQSHCRIYGQCPPQDVFVKIGRRMGTPSFTVDKVHRELIRDSRFEREFMNGRPEQQQKEKLYEIILNRPLSNQETLISTPGRFNYKTYADALFRTAEYKTRFGSDVIPGNDYQGSDIVRRGLPKRTFEWDI